MTDISALLNRYLELADEANRGGISGSCLETLLKRHIRDLAREGGPDHQPLRMASPSGECNGDWVACSDGSCVPPEVGC